MIGALVLLGLVVAVGLILWALDRRGRGREADAKAEPEETPAAPAPAHGPFCCGLHVVCEEGLPKPDEPVYYDDEELDAYIGRDAASYTDAETEMFRDVLLTLLPTDIAGWDNSLRLRGIALPEGVRDEMIMIIAEAREELLKTAR